MKSPANEDDNLSKVEKHGEGKYLEPLHVISIADVGDKLQPTSTREPRETQMKKYMYPQKLLSTCPW